MFRKPSYLVFHPHVSLSPSVTVRVTVTVTVTISFSCFSLSLSPLSVSVTVFVSACFFYSSIILSDMRESSRSCLRRYRVPASVLTIGRRRCRHWWTATLSRRPPSRTTCPYQTTPPGGVDGGDRWRCQSPSCFFCPRHQRTHCKCLPTTMMY